MKKIKLLSGSFLDIFFKGNVFVFNEKKNNFYKKTWFVVWFAQEQLCPFSRYS